MASVHRVVQHHPHQRADDDHCHKGRRDTEHAAGHDALEGREPGSVAESLRLIVSDETREPAIDEQAAERDDEGLQPQACDEEAVDRAQERAESEDRQHGEGPWDMPLGQHHAQEYAE